MSGVGGVVGCVCEWVWGGMIHKFEIFKQNILVHSSFIMFQQIWGSPLGVGGVGVCGCGCGLVGESPQI